MKVPLRMTFRPSAQRAATAYFVPGASPEEWLHQVDQWKVPHQSLRCLVICRWDEPAKAEGLLVLLPNHTKPLPSGLGIPFGQIGERFYLPVEGVLEPALEAAEIEKLIQSGPAICVWSPAYGFVQFAPGDVRRIADWVKLPSIIRGDWKGAQPGESRPTKLVELAPRQEPSPEQVIEQAREGIGGMAGERPIETPHPAESGPVTRGLQALGGAAASALSKTPLLPATWAQSLQQWAKSLMQSSADSLSAMRNREMVRLMNLLEKNPDEGLQFAIPLRADQAPRGVAPPGANLVKREVNFGGGGGGAADPWDIRKYEAELLRRYHALAVREIQLGRHRRAAYIYAELLGNLELAASTLEQGGDYREAAVIYEKRLNRPQQAAECFLRGGLWTEAIRLFEQLEQHERVGDIFARIGETERSRLAYERALDQRRQANDYLDAVRILETKLLDLDRAIELALIGWPETPQAHACLRKHLELLEKAGRHVETAQRLRTMTASRLVSRRQLDLVETMSLMAQRYPDPEVRTVAKDRTRFLASQLLKAKGVIATDEILASVQRLEPEEKILARDCRRFREQVGRKSTSMGKRAAKPPTSGAIQRIKLPAGVTWKSAVGLGKYFYAAGWRDGRLVALRGAWSGATQLAPKPWHATPAGGEILLAIQPVAANSAALFIHPAMALTLKFDQNFAIDEGELHFQQRVTSAKVFTSSTVAFACTGSDTLCVVDRTDAEHFTLKWVYYSGDLLVKSEVVKASPAALSVLPFLRH